MAPHQNVVILRVLIAWNQMHMEVEYCLSCNFVIILKNIKSITAQNLCHMSCKLLGKLHGFSCNFLIDIIDICIVLFRKNQRVSF